MKRTELSTFSEIECPDPVSPKSGYIEVSNFKGSLSELRELRFEKFNCQVAISLVRWQHTNVIRASFSGGMIPGKFCHVYTHH